MSRNFGLPPREEFDETGAGFFTGIAAALAIEGVAALVGFLGFVVWINGYSIFAQLGVWK